MTAYIALLRAVNVGGTGKLAMTDLTRLCQAAGFSRIKTYIASGNVVFWSDASEPEVKAALEAQLAAYAGKPVGVLVRTAGEMAQVLADDPFPDGSRNRVMAIFLDDAPAADALASATGVQGEQMRLGAREIYVFYPDGQANTKLRLPAAKTGTARNMNTVAKLAEMAAGWVSA